MAYIVHVTAILKIGGLVQLYQWAATSMDLLVSIIKETKRNSITNFFSYIITFSLLTAITKIDYHFRNSMLFWNKLTFWRPCPWISSSNVFFLNPTSSFSSWIRYSWYFYHYFWSTHSFSVSYGKISYF